MKSFFIKFSCFVFPLLGILFFLEYYNLVRPQNQITAKIKMLKEQKPALVLIGSSHGRDGINPKEINDKAVNACIGGAGLFYSKYIIENLTPDEVKQIILTVSYQSLYRNFNAEETINKRYEFYHYLGADLNLNDHFFNYKKWSILLTIGFKNALKNLMKDLQTDDDIYKTAGFTGHTKTISAKALEREAPIRIRLHHQQMEASAYSQNMQYLEDIQKHCISKNIALTLVTTPVSKNYLQMEVDSFRNFRNKIQTFAEKHKVQYLDYSEDNDFQVKHFKDPDHLNLKGAKVLSSKIKNQLH